MWACFVASSGRGKSYITMTVLDTQEVQNFPPKIPGLKVEQGYVNFPKILAAISKF
jgi:hypothetical protein